MAIVSNDLLNTRIDLSDILSWRAAQTPRFIGLFQLPRGENARYATNTEHFWLEGVETPKTKAFTSYNYGVGGAGEFTVADAAGWQVGDLFHILGDAAVLKIVSVSGAAISASLVASNGSALALEDYAPSSPGTLIFDSRPIQEGSGSGEDFFLQSHAESNFTQIFRGDVELSATAAAVDQAGSENAIATQLQYATDAILRRMNSALIFGAKTRRTAVSPGSMGGLYYYGSQEGGLRRAYNDSALTMNKINLAAQDVTNAGCIPDAIVCGAGQAQIVSAMMDSQVRIPQGSHTIGSHVDTFVTSAGGNVMRVVVEPSIPDTDVWVCDTRGFSLIPLSGRGLHSEPATAPGVDGVRAIVIGEYTAEFKNAKQALCRISGLKASSEVLT